MDVWGVCGGESRGVSVGMSGVGRSGRGCLCVPWGYLGGQGGVCGLSWELKRGLGGVRCVRVCGTTHTPDNPQTPSL